MCGIAGVLGTGDESLLEVMLCSLRHRGPDAQGKFQDVDNNVLMGNQRLSIVDPEGGTQPFYNEDGTVAVVFNGEIYNHQLLRDRLEDAGHRFETGCDTEVLVHLWEEYGRDMPTHLDGMFAFSIWDQTSETLFLARDRMGIKPLYYAESETGFVWASELQSVLKADVGRTVDSRAVYNYFSLRYSPWPRTLLEQVSKVPPGCSITVTDDGISQQRYWSLDVTGSPERSRSGAVSRIRELLESSVQQRLMADVPLGAFLSGGLDSSAIVGLLSEHSEGPVETFSMGFQSDRYDESEEARFVADHFQTNHHEFTVDLSTMDVFGTVVSHFGEPLADPAVLPTTLLASSAAEEVKVVLTGEGADELFAGYDYFQRVPRHRRWASHVPEQLFDFFDWAQQVAPVENKYVRYLSSLESDEEAILNWVRGYGTPVDEYVDVAESPETSGLRSLVTDSFDDVRPGLLNRLMAFKLRHWLPDDLLYKVDHSTMAHSLEARVPFLDHELVEYVASLPAEWKATNGGYKPLLNDAVSDVVPNRIRNREKHGFRVPIDEWFRQEVPAISRWLTEERISATPHIRTDDVMSLWDAHRRDKANHKGALWKSLNYVAWYHTVVYES